MFPHLKNFVHPKSSTQMIYSYFFASIAGGMFDTVLSLYLNLQFGLSNSTIGVIGGVIVFLSVVLSLQGSKLMRHFSELKLFYSLIVLVSLFLVGLFMIDNLYLALLLLLLVSVFRILKDNCFVILYKDNTKKKEEESSQGLYFTFGNAAYFIAPLIGGFLLSLYSPGSIFLFMSVSFLVSILVIHYKEIKSKKIKHSPQVSIIKNLEQYFLNKNYFLAYMMMFTTQFWFGFVFIFVPLFMINAGIRASEIGIFLAFSSLGLILTNYYIAKLSEKRKLKNFFFISFFLTALCLIACFFTENIYWIVFFVLLSSITIMISDPLQLLVFQRTAKRSDYEDMYPVFWTSAYTGGLFVSITVAAILYYLPQSYSFLYTGLFILGVALLSLKLEV